MKKKLRCEKVEPENKQGWQVARCKFRGFNQKYILVRVILVHLIDPIYVKSANAWMVTANRPIVSACSFVLAQHLFRLKCTVLFNTHNLLHMLHLPAQQLFAAQSNNAQSSPAGRSLKHTLWA